MYRKSYEVVGATEDGDAYCAEHASEEALSESPVFLDEAEGFNCDTCGEELDA